MSTPIWNPLLVCDMKISVPGERNVCCGNTKRGEPCKSFVKSQELKTGRQNLEALAASPFDLFTLRPVLEEIAKYFLCARWHRN